MSFPYCRIDLCSCSTGGDPAGGDAHWYRHDWSYYGIKRSQDRTTTTTLFSVIQKWDKAALSLANMNSKAINVIFCGVSPDEFHRISHVKTAKEA